MLTGTKDVSLLVDTLKAGCLIVIHEAADKLVTFGVFRRILLTGRDFSPVTKSFINSGAPHVPKKIW